VFVVKRLLALETSGDVGSVALLVGESIAERTIASPREQTASILPHVHALLAEAGIELKDLDGVAFGRGPGSFTGIRVATAVAHGFGVALGLPLLPVSSLAAIAQGVWRSRRIERCLVGLDARMGEVFWACYSIRDGLATLSEAERLSGPDAVETAFTGPWAAAGGAFAAYRTELTAVMAAAACVLPDATATARDLLPFALDDLAHGRVTALEAALPVYLRREDAWRR
jgi:tRNA threonylcarbamoyladenosine biosynthesis protein TsaB